MKNYDFLFQRLATIFEVMDLQSEAFEIKPELAHNGPDFQVLFERLATSH